MRVLVLIILFLTPGRLCLAQKNLISVEDIKYLLHNNLQQADTFLVSKGYSVAKKDNNSKNRLYSCLPQAGVQNDIHIRLDGKKIFIEIESNVLQQYNLIRESISQYINKDSMAADVQVFTVKDLGSVYITVNDTQPYNPLKKDYDIQVVGDKNITAYN